MSGQLNRPKAQDTCLSDAALVAMAQTGNAEAFSAVCLRYEYRLMRTALRITKNHEDAQDSVQEAFMNAFKNLDTYNGSAQFSTWLTRIVINCCLIQLRKRASRRTVSLEDCLEGGEALIDLLPDHSFDVEQYLMQEQHRHLLEKAITQLRPTLRIAVEMYTAHDCSVPELAMDLGVTVGTVKSRLHHARRQLKRSRTLAPALLLGR